MEGGREGEDREGGRREGEKEREKENLTLTIGKEGLSAEGTPFICGSCRISDSLLSDFMLRLCHGCVRGEYVGSLSRAIISIF